MVSYVFTLCGRRLFRLFESALGLSISLTSIFLLKVPSSLGIGREHVIHVFVLLSCS